MSFPVHVLLYFISSLILIPIISPSPLLLLCSNLPTVSYTTAEDAGSGPIDMAHVFSRTRFTTCIPPELGGSGNPSGPTALGVASGIEAALQFVHGSGVQGRTIAVQGIGNVARFLVTRLLEMGAKHITVADIDDVQLERARVLFAGKPVTIRKVDRHDNSILFEDVDVIAPCALGGSINSETIPKIRAKIICGAANNQLLHPVHDDYLLFERGIVNCFDSCVNRMGIVNCANEDSGYVQNDSEIQKHFDPEYEFSIPSTLKRILTISREKNIPPLQVAYEIADELILQDHPIFPGRVQRIIDTLVDSKWDQQPRIAEPFEFSG
jgi:glutamate dehydrogenase (NAD(P)+)